MELVKPVPLEKSSAGRRYAPRILIGVPVKGTVSTTTTAFVVMWGLKNAAGKALA